MNWYMILLYNVIFVEHLRLPGVILVANLTPKTIDIYKWTKSGLPLPASNLPAVIEIKKNVYG